MASERHNVASDADFSATSDYVSRARDEGGHNQGMARAQQASNEEAIAFTMQVLNFLGTTNSPPALDLTDEQKSLLIDLHGRQSDQAFSFRKQVLAVVCIAFCLLLLATVGLVVFLTLQGEIAFASEIVAGAFGMVSGLFTGIGGTLGFIAPRRWWQ